MEYAYEDALKLNLRKAPLQLEFLRIVNIEGYEYNACSGTHVKSTGEVGIVKVIKSEKYKSGTRVEFLCGKRALTDYMMKNKITAVLSSKLSCGTEMISENFGKISDENKRLKKDIDKLRSELNEYKAKNFKSSAVSKNGIKYIFIKSEDDIKDLRFICSKISEEENYFSFFASESNSKCSMIIGQSGNLNIDIKTIFEKCKELINGKGGGSSFLMQCTGDIMKGSECIELAKEILIE
jgi:alanyl-tRNA synthetase